MELAYEACLDRTRVSAIERGVANPTVETLATICYVLGITLSDLFEPLALSLKPSGKHRRVQHRNPEAEPYGRLPPLLLWFGKLERDRTVEHDGQGLVRRGVPRVSTQFVGFPTRIIELRVAGGHCSRRPFCRVEKQQRVRIDLTVALYAGNANREHRMVVQRSNLAPAADDQSLPRQFALNECDCIPVCTAFEQLSAQAAIEFSDERRQFAERNTLQEHFGRFAPERSLKLPPSRGDRRWIFDQAGNLQHHEQAVHHARRIEAALLRVDGMLRARSAEMNARPDERMKPLNDEVHG